MARRLGDDDPTALEVPSVGRQLLGLGMIAASFLFAFVIQSVFFSKSNWMLADLAYHRGVAYTMQGDDVPGRGILCRPDQLLRRALSARTRTGLGDDRPHVRLGPERRIMVRNAADASGAPPPRLAAVAQRPVRHRVLRDPRDSRGAVHHELGRAVGREHPAFRRLLLAGLSARYCPRPRLHRAVGGAIGQPSHAHDRVGPHRRPLPPVPRPDGHPPGVVPHPAGGLAGRQVETAGAAHRSGAGRRNCAGCHSVVVDPTAHRVSPVRDAAHRRPCQPSALQSRPARAPHRLRQRGRPRPGRNRLFCDQASERHSGLDLRRLDRRVSATHRAQPGGSGPRSLHGAAALAGYLTGGGRPRDLRDRRRHETDAGGGPGSPCHRHRRAAVDSRESGHGQTGEERGERGLAAGQRWNGPPA